MATRRSGAKQGLAVGQRLGPYRLVTLLGEGRIGLVFRALREPDGESVALKILRDELAEDALYRHRFHREGRIASGLAHPHVVPVVDYGEASGRLYVAARYVPGVSLAELISTQGALPLAQTLSLVNDVSAGLDALHARDLVHRDVKPANVMVDEGGSAALTDFGLARGVADTVLTKTGMVVGTVDYLAPELIRGRPATPASDVYALGCLAYECLAGRPPFAGKTFVDALLAHVQEQPPELSAIQAELPDGLSWAVSTALAKDPGERPPSATAYARLLRASAKAG